MAIINNKIVLLSWIALLCVVSAEETSRGSYRLVYGKEQHFKRFESEGGYIEVVPIYRGSSEMVPELLNYEASITHMQPSSMILPQYMDADWYTYCLQGKARIGYVAENRLVEQDIEQGEVYYVPKGSLCYLINMDDTQPLRLNNLLYNDNPSPLGRLEHKNFFVAGERSMVSRFSKEMAAALGVPEEVVQLTFGTQKRGPIIRLNREHMRRIRESSPQMQTHAAAEVAWPWSSSSCVDRKPFNMLRKRPDLSNDNGQQVRADGHDFCPLGRRNVGIAVTHIQEGAMIVPHWANRATRVSFVTDGCGLVHMAASSQSCGSQSGSQSQSQTETETEVEEEEEEEEEVSSGRRHHHHHRRCSVVAQVEKGDVIVIPAGNPSSLMANRGKNLQMMTWFINARGNQLQCLAGKNNVMGLLNENVMCAALDVDCQKLQKMLSRNTDEQLIMRCHSEHCRRGRRGDNEDENDDHGRGHAMA